MKETKKKKKQKKIIGRRKFHSQKQKDWWLMITLSPLRSRNPRRQTQSEKVREEKGQLYYSEYMLRSFMEKEMILILIKSQNGLSF